MGPAATGGLPSLRIVAADIRMDKYETDASGRSLDQLCHRRVEAVSWLRRLLQDDREAIPEH
jgi:hypothetical protein